MLKFIYLKNLLIFISINLLVITSSTIARTKRVGVIGSGISGMVAAKYLKKRGYDVTVLEKENRVGGKIYTYKYNDKKYDIGAVWVSHNFETIMELIKEYDIELEPYKVKSFIYRDSDQISKNLNEFTFLQYFWKKNKLKDQAQSIINSYKLTQKYSYIDKPGFHHIDLNDDKLLESTEEFVKNEKIEAIADLADKFMVACGYGYFDEIPSVYFMKIFQGLFKIRFDYLLNIFKSSSFLGFNTFKNGFQSFLEKIAETEKIKVITNSEVVKIEKNKIINEEQEEQNYEINKKIKVTTKNSKEYIFDKVVISIPLNLLPKIMAKSIISDRQKNLFSKIKTYRYYSSLIEADGLPKNWITFFEANNCRKRIGHLGALGDYSDGTNVYQITQIVDDNMSEEEIFKIAEKDIIELGGKNIKKIVQKEWHYFPHIDSETFKKGFFVELNDIQGQNGVYYIGSTLSFESTKRSSDFSKYLIEREFRDLSE